MSDHHVLAAISRYLRHTLWLGFKADEAVRALILREPAIRISPPNSADGEARLFLWLYEVRPNRYLASHPGVRPHVGAAAPPPLPLDQDGADLVVLARAMQIMAAMPHVAMPGGAEEDELRVTHEEPPLEEQVALWRALREPMRLAAFYQVGVARIDPLDPDTQ